MIEVTLIAVASRSPFLWTMLVAFDHPSGQSGQPSPVTV
jgi:hypothetical protein